MKTVLIAERKREQRVSGVDGDVLSAVHGEAHRAAVDLPAERDLPQQGARPRVERVEIAFLAAAEQQIGCGGENARPGGVAHLELPLRVERLRIERADDA